MENNWRNFMETRRVWGKRLVRLRKMMRSMKKMTKRSNGKKTLFSEE